MTRFANVFLASIFFVALSACSDLEGDANALFVEVANELQAAEETSGLVEYQLLQAAQKKLVRLTTPEFSRTAVAVKVVSGNKVGPLSADELRARLAILEGTPEVCGAIRTVACATRLIAATPLKIPAPIRDEQVRLLVELALYSNLAGIQAPVERIMQTVPTVADGQRFALDFASSAALGRVSETVFPRLTAAAILDYSSAVSADFGPVLDNRFTIFSLGDGLRLLQEPETMIAVVSGWPEASRASAAMSLLPAARKLPLPQRLEVMDAIFASLSLPEDRKRGLASYAIGGEEQLAEALSIAANDGEKLSAKKAVYDANKARLSGPEKFVSLIDLAQSTSEGVVRDLLRLAFENRAEQKIAGTAIEQAATIASSMSPSSDDAELFRVMAAVYEGSIKPEGLVSSAKEATRFDILRMCSEYPWFLRKLERSDLVPDLASVCDLWLRSNAFDRSIRGNVIKILIVEAALAGPDIHREVVQILGDATVSENLMSIVPELVRNDATEIARSMMDKVRNKNPDDLVWTLPDDQQLAAAQLAAYLAVLKATGTEHLGR